MSLYFGVDIGGTKTSVGIFDGSNPVSLRTFATECELGAENLVERIALNYRQLLEETHVSADLISAAGVASPGPLDLAKGEIVHIPTMNFKAVPIKSMLEKALGLTVFLENDANCAALAEARIGTCRGSNSLAYVTVSTGVGCGIISDGKIVDGSEFCAGELGHLTVEFGGKDCACGKKGCLERYASGTGIADVAFEILGERLTAKDVFLRAENGDTACENIIKQAVDYLSRGIAALCQITDCGNVVLGGSVMKNDKVIMPLLKKSLSEYLQPVIAEHTRLYLSGFDGAQVIYGAVLYAAECKNT